MHDLRVEELDSPIFTVFTPTYNRAHTLPRVYQSLKEQTFRSFEWLIVDDGSTDGTYELISRWQRENTDFLIRYSWQQNKGKHVAFNRAVQESRAEFFLPLDSDDACVPEALERFKFHWDSISIEQRKLFTGVCALCCDQNGKIVGDYFPFNPTDSNSLEIHYRYKVKGEKWGFQRSEVLRQYPFPEVKGARYVPEGVVWSTIAKSYKIRFVNEALRIYFIQNALSSDQITHSLSHPYRNPIGGAYYYAFQLNEESTWFRYSPWVFFKSAANYVRFSLHSGIGILRSLHKIRPTLAKGLFLVTLPIGGTVYTLEKKNIDVVSKFAFASKTMRAWKSKLFRK
jgi:glycosyltransferase involved in cell wall biosynthesis